MPSDQMSLTEVLVHPWAALRRLQGLDRFPDRRVSRKPLGSGPDPTDPIRSRGRAEAVQRALGLYALEETRVELYENYMEMDSDAMISAVLDAYADDAGQFDAEHKRIVWVEAQNLDIENILTATMDRIKLDTIAFPILRSLARDGDAFEHVALARNKGVVALRSYQPWTVARIEDDVGRLLGFAPANERGDPSDVRGCGVRFDQALHFRLQSRDRNRSYGATSSFLWGSRIVWRELQLMEDQVVIQRLLRRPDRILYLMDVTGMSYDESWYMIKQYERWLNREIFLNPESGDFRSQGLPLDPSKDLVLPRGPDNKTQATNFPATNTNDLMRDVDYILQRLAAGIGFPLGFIGRGGNYQPGQSLSRQFQPFAKKATRLQRAFLDEVARLLLIDLAYKGVDPTHPRNAFSVNMASVAPIVEIERAEIVQLRMERMRAALVLGKEAEVNGDVWVPYVLEKYGGLPRELVKELRNRAAQQGSQVPPPGALKEALDDHLAASVPPIDETVCVSSHQVDIGGDGGACRPSELNETTGRGMPAGHLQDWDCAIPLSAAESATLQFKQRWDNRARTRIRLVCQMAGCPVDEDEIDTRLYDAARMSV